MLNKNSGGYVLVDMKPENIMVTKDAQVSLIDFDSIQVNVTGKKSISCIPVAHLNMPP